eukprot:1373492-Pleurochrysis_carterae.AAC.4
MMTNGKIHQAPYQPHSLGSRASQQPRSPAQSPFRCPALPSSTTASAPAVLPCQASGTVELGNVLSSRSPVECSESVVRRGMPPKDVPALYATLSLTQAATETEIKRAYLLLARKNHPDKCPDDENAHERFLAISRAYSILSDPEKRKLYDATGLAEDGAPPQASGSWADFWRDFYKRVSLEELEKLSKDYKGSEAERQDLFNEYLATKGDMDRIMDAMMHSTAEDEPRFRQMLQACGGH